MFDYAFMVANAGVAGRKWAQEQPVDILRAAQMANCIEFLCQVIADTGGGLVTFSATASFSPLRTRPWT